MARREELEDKIDEFEIERDTRLENRGGSKRTEDPDEIEDPEDQDEPRSFWDRPKPKKGTYPSVGPHGPGDLDVEGDWEGPIDLFEFEDIEEGWINCTTGFYWHSVLGGGIYQYEDEWYRHWDFDYKPPENEIILEESGDTEQEDPKIPQDPTEGETVTEQAEGTEEEKSPVSQQDKPTQPKPPCPHGHSRPQTDLDPSTFMRTRQQQRAQDLLTSLTPEEAQTGENNIAHIKHLREAIKKGIEK